METGLEGKPWYLGLAIGMALSTGLFMLFHLKLFDNKRAEITKKEAKIQELERQVAEGQAAKKSIKQFQEEVGRLELELEQLLSILPPRKNTPELIRRIRTLTEEAGFNLQVFDPAESETDRDFYTEWPITISLQGGYHELARFFDRISRFRRIINVDNLRMSANSRGGHTLGARFTAKTFVYKEVQPEPEQPKQQGRRRGRGG